MDSNATSTRYEIKIHGRVDSSLSAMFANIAVTTDKEATRIVANIRDSAELHGMLDRLQSLGIDLISVNPIAGPADPERSGSP